MNYEELLQNRRSIRSYTDEAVPDDVLQRIIQESTYAPSSGNEQPWKFIVVKDQSLMQRLSDEAKRNILAHIESNPDAYAKKYENIMRAEYYNIFYNAPRVVFILGDKSLKNSRINCALAAGYFMMSATAHSLGTCWIGFATVLSPETKAELGIPGDCEIVAPITIGYPAKIPSMPARKQPEILNII